MKRTLVLIRHAQAEQFAPSDRERPLTERGQHDAVAAGRLLSDLGVSPGQAIVSTALRTRQTWQALAEQARWDVDPWFDETLYEAGPESILELLHSIEETTNCAVVVGHNPGLALAAHLLNDGTAEHVGEFGTSAVAVFEHDLPWRDLEVASIALRHFALARG